MQYTQDFDETYVPSGGGNTISDSTWSPTLNWNDPLLLVDPYLKSNQLLICPSDSGGQSKSMKNATPRGNAYGMNNRFDKVALSDVEKPAITIMLYDGLTPWNRIDRQSQTNHARPRHLDGINFAFADGHAKWMKLNNFTGARFYGDYPVYDNNCDANTFYRTRIDASPGARNTTGGANDCG